MPELVIILIAIAFSAFFSGMEIAFISSNKLRIEIDRKHNDFPSRILSIFTHHPSRYIATMLVGNNIALVIYGLSFARLLDSPLRDQLHIESEAAVLIIQTILSTLLILITAEFLPKTLFRINPNALLKVFSLPVLLFYLLLYPVTLLTILISNFTMRYLLRVPVENGSPEPVFGKVDLNHLVMESNQQETEDREELKDLKLFKNALELSTLKVRDCMIPRTEIVAQEIESPVEELMNAFNETGYSRILVYRESIDNVIGYVNSKDMFHTPEHIGNHLKSLPIVPETLPVNKMLRTFIRDGKSIALVLDEYGGTSGIITTEDIIEEIFGEIEDEHDTVELIEKKVDARTFRFSGRLEIDYLNEQYNLDLPESEEYDTLAGLIIYHQENIPEENETIGIRDFTIRISRVSANRIEEVLLMMSPEM